MAVWNTPNERPPISPKQYKENTSQKNTHIGHNAWIAVNCIIRQEVIIGEGAVIGAGSFVNKDVLPYAIVFVSPAKIHKYRFDFDQETIDKLDESNYWEYDPKKAKTRLRIIKIDIIETKQ